VGDGDPLALPAVLAGDALAAAPHLLGARIAAGAPDDLVVVRLTEVEAYAGVGEDPGSHAHRGPTRRNATMFGRAGLLYAYFTYGMHWCLNVVCGPEGTASAVLLRAGAVVDGLEVARSRVRASAPERELARGPARLARVLGADGSLDGVDLLDPRSPVRLLPAAGGSGQVRTGPRVGVAGEGAGTPWRFWLADEPTVSTYRAAAPPRVRRSGRLSPRPTPSPPEPRP
jgi:DNA-3-methyladenine glycosylase